MGLNNNYFTFKKNCGKGNSVLLVPHLFYDHLFHMHPSIDFTASSSIYYFMLEAVLGFQNKSRHLTSFENISGGSRICLVIPKMGAQIRTCWCFGSASEMLKFLGFVVVYRREEETAAVCIE